MKTLGMKDVRWGIIGCGNVTEVKSGPAFNKVPGSRLVAVMRRNAAAAADYARRHGVPKWYDDADALIADPEVDVVYVATPPDSHASLALKVASADKPCYVEKPMARNASECVRMCDAFQHAGQPLFVAYYRRALPQFSRIREMIERREFGPLRSLDYTFSSGRHLAEQPLDDWRFQPEISGGGLFWDIGSHALDIFDFLLGPLRDVDGAMANHSGRSMVEEEVRLTAVGGDSGTALSASWNFASAESTDHAVLRFEKATLHCAILGIRELRIVRADGSVANENFVVSKNIQQNLIANVVSAIRESTPALSTGESALRTNQVIDQLAA